MTASRLRPWAVPVLVFVLVSGYRFNTLGGALGGFDNDHFLHFIYAKQVQAGDQPLRDFLDGGLQGARPSLTYELSAAAQRLLGNNLRSEAVLTVGGVALGTAVTYAAARMAAPWPAALVLAGLTALVSPKLYGYPKVLVLAVMSFLILEYARRPRWITLAAMAGCTAVAFLFRHDYAVYCGVGGVLVIAGAHGRSVASIARPVAFGALTLALVSPSLWWIQRYAGLEQYLRNGYEMGEREAQRTDLSWPVFDRGTGGLDGIVTVENSEAWLYYVFLAVPAVALLSAFARRRERREGGAETAALIALVVVTAMLDRYFLRGSLEARFGDMAPVIAVLAAVLIGRAATPGSGSRRIAHLAVAAVLLAVSAVSVWTIGSARPELERAGLTVSPAAVVRQARRVSAELRALPAQVWGDGAATSSMAVARDLHRCTGVDDRILVATFAPEIAAFADRRFAGGRASLIPGFYTSPRDTALTLQRLRSERVPFVLAEEDDEYYAEFPELFDYVRAHYAEIARVEIDGNRRIRVFGQTVGGNAAAPGPGGFRGRIEC